MKIQKHSYKDFTPSASKWKKFCQSNECSMIKNVLDNESKILESTLVNYHHVMKESDYIENFRCWKKEYDNLNTLHKEFMKRETFSLAKKILAKEVYTKE